jgi:hypothetical protein
LYRLLAEAVRDYTLRDLIMFLMLESGAMAVPGYTRVSTDKQADDGNGLDIQQRQISGYAMMHGMEVDGVYVEAGVSGSVPLSQRPEGSAMLARLQRGDVVIVAKLDRAVRSARDALDVLKARGVALHMIDMGGDGTGWTVQADVHRGVCIRRGGAGSHPRAHPGQQGARTGRRAVRRRQGAIRVCGGRRGRPDG